MLVRDGVVTDRVEVPWIEPEAAVMVVLPAATPWASPVLLIVAIEATDELHETAVVIVAVLLSE